MRKTTVTVRCVVFLFLCVTSLAWAESSSHCDTADYVGQSRVPERLLEPMQLIAQAFCESGAEKQLTVTSGARSPMKQAQLMQKCLQSNSCGYYANQQAVREIQASYDAAAATLKISAVAQTIEDQINRSEPCFVSKHLTDYGLDLERWSNGSSHNCEDDLTGDDLILSTVLQQSEDVSNVVYRESSACTHFHVNFLGWDQIPGLKRCRSAAEHK